MAPDNKTIPDYVDHSTGNFVGKYGTKIFYQQWAPKTGDVRGVILIVHGIAEHSGRYTELASRFVRQGYVVGALDHRGHGRSEGKRVQIKEFDDLADDVAVYESILREQYPAPLPLFVIGHSMGGLIALHYVTRPGSKTEAQGIVISGAAAAKPEDISDITVTIGKLLANILPDLGIADLQLDMISKDPEVVADYKADPLVTIAKIRTRMAAELLGGMETVKGNLPSATLPILIMHGGDDVITPPHGSEMIYETIGSPDKQIKIYDGLYHEIYNEPERDVVVSDVEVWLDKQVNSAS